MKPQIGDLVFLPNYFGIIIDTKYSVDFDETQYYIWWSNDTKIWYDLENAQYFLDAVTWAKERRHEKTTS